MIRLTLRFNAATAGKLAAVPFCCAFVLALALSAFAQESQPAQTQPQPPATTPSPAPDSTQQPAPTAAQPAPQQNPSTDAAPPQQPPPAPSQAKNPATKDSSQSEGIKEEELKQMLVGKPLYLRGGYLDNSLTFNDHGILTGSSPQGSFTLSGVQIDRVHLSKHKLELEGSRYALRFLGGNPNDDPTKSVDRVKITPKKKVLKITVDREQVEIPKKPKENNKDKKTTAKNASPPPPVTAPLPGTVTPAQASALLKSALDRVFSNGVDDRLIASMPDYWKLYYKASASNSDYRPADPAVLRQTMVDKKARLVSAFEPPSNEYAQAHAVAGLANYYAVIDADGKPGEIAVGRPIGFGLDENAVATIRKATFEPAIKDGKPVPVLLDLVVQFRIYSNRTAATSKVEEGVDKPAQPTLPGPYSVQKP
jgi:outer membrane biosynthesis protein TonB